MSEVSRNYGGTNKTVINSPLCWTSGKVGFLFGFQHRIVNFETLACFFPDRVFLNSSVS